MTDEQRKIRDLTKHMKDLTSSVEGFLARLDVVMRQPSSEAKGRRIAKLSNDLEMANDTVRYFGLGIDFRGDGKRKAKIRAAAERLEAEAAKELPR